MNGKRFVLCKKGDVEYIEDNGCVQLYGFDVLCEMLNELNDENKALKKENEWLRKELKGLNKKYIAFSEATDKRLKEMMKWR